MLALACSNGDHTAPPPPSTPVLSVGGGYQTAVTLESSTCPGQTVEQHETAVNHLPGGTVLTLLHANSKYPGTIAADGSFTTAPVRQVFGGISYEISIAGQFSATGMDALVTVAAAQSPPCGFTARWAGPKIGEPNVIP